MIIVEGPDGSGKSTLAETMRRVHRIVEFEHSPSQLLLDGKLHEWLTWIEWALAVGPDGRSLRARYLFDRFPIISELVYGPLFRNLNMLEGSDHVVRWICLRPTPLVIYCRPPLGAILSNVGAVPEDPHHSNPKMVVKVVAAYDQLMLALNEHITVLWYDYLAAIDSPFLFEKVELYLSGRPILRSI